MRGAATKAEKARGENINLRVSRGQKSLIDRAAQALGRNRSDFMLETACREAESVLLDRRYFILAEEQFKRFTAMLDQPPASNPRLARLLKTRAPWDKWDRQPRLLAFVPSWCLPFQKRAKRFYEKWGFIASPVEPMTLMITVAEARKAMHDKSE